LALNANETQLLSVAGMLETLKTSVSQAPEGRITIIQRGANPALVAQGRVTDSVTGFSTTLQFPDPARQRASALHASGIPIGTPTADSPYAGDGYFTPHVIASNLLDKPQTVTITVEYPKGSAWQSVEGPGGPATPHVRVKGPFKKGSKDPNEVLNNPPNPDPATLTSQFTLAPLTVGAYGTMDFSLDAVMNQLPLPLPYASLRIQYSGPPGSVIAQVSSVDEHQGLVVDARTMNEGDGWAGSGSNPWRLDSATDSILFLTDESDSPARIGLDVTAGGVHYYLIRLQLAPHETRAINLRALRDAQTPDLKGNKIPAGATDGAVNWVRLDSVPVEGRMMVIQKQQGMASSYDCASCPCPAGFSTLNAAPDLFSLPPGYYDDIFDTGLYYDCNGYQFYIDVTYSTTYSSGNTSVIQMDSSVHNRADAIAGGTSPITSTVVACTRYDTNPDLPCPCISLRTFYASSTGNVCGLSISSPTSGQVIDLGGTNYNSATIILEAASACSGTVNWTLLFNYTNTGGATYSDTQATSNTIGQTLNYNTQLGDAGQVYLTAKAELYGQTFQVNNTIYVDGASIPKATITSRLDGLYSGATPGLLTGIAMTESSYYQFISRSLYQVPNGVWPNENAPNQFTPAGAYVGLMQVPNGLLPAFDWITNTSTGAIVFQSKLADANNYVASEQSQYPQLPSLSGQELEKEALSFYGGFSSRYHLVNSTGTGWDTTTRTDLLTYVQNVFNNVQ